MSNLDELHREAIQRFHEVQQEELEQRELAVEDMRFAHAEDGQWDELALNKTEGRPRYTLNRVAGAINQIVGDQRQNVTGVTVIPEGEDEEDVAKILSGIIRNVERDSFDATNRAFDEMVTCGYGGFRLITEFEEDGFDQVIKCHPIMSAATSLWFGPCDRYDKSDAEFAFLTKDMPNRQYEREYPDYSMSDFSQVLYSSNFSCNVWKSPNTIKIAEYWVKEPMQRTIYRLQDGSVVEELPEATPFIESRTFDSHKVVQYIMNGMEVISGPHDFPSKHIPLIAVSGISTMIEGVLYQRGIVRQAKDANRIYNYATSAAIETSALTPKDPYFITPSMMKGHESIYKNFNIRNQPFMPYNPDARSPGPPQRGGAPALQPAFVQQIQQASMDLYHITGLQPPSLGVNPELKSGKAIQAEQSKGDRGSFIYLDNLSKSKDYMARIILDIIPHIYDRERTLTLINDDETSEVVDVNQTNNPNVPTLDLRKGKFNVQTKVGPAFSTQREQSSEQLLQLITQSPELANVSLDLLVKSLPILDSTILHDRIRKQMIKAGTIEPTEKEIKDLGLDKSPPPDPQQEALTENIKLQTEKLIAEIEASQIRDDKTEAEVDKLQAQTAEILDKLGGDPSALRPTKT